MIYLIFKYALSIFGINMIIINGIRFLPKKIGKFIYLGYLILFIINVLLLYNLSTNYSKYKEFRELDEEKMTLLTVNGKKISKECQNNIFKSLRRENFVLPSFPYTSKKYYITIITKEEELNFRINQVKDLETLITLKRGNQDVTTYRNNQLYWILKDCIDER